ncbi:MAG TPA: oligosaccharide flippase family protein [Solirubrobacteraceae bacterium]
MAERGVGDEGRPEPPPSLRQITVRGAQLATAGYLLSNLVLFVVYVVLARLIGPEQFGAYAAASVVTGVGTLFAESGMMSALIRRADRIEEAASTAFYSLLIGGVLLSLAALALSPLVGLFFRTPGVEGLAAALSGWLFLRALTVVPDALLQRRFSYARRVAVDPLGALAFAAASIIACANGAGAWGLVAGAYASMLVQVVSAWWFVRFRPRLRLASIRMWRELASFARPVLASEIVNQAATQIDTLALGRFQGAASLGQYRNGLRLAQQPSSMFVSVGAYVLLPALARMAHQPERLATSVRRVFELLAATALPLSLSLLPLGEPVAVLLLGPRWRPAGHAIAGLCGILIGIATASVASEVFKAVGRPRILVPMHLVNLCTMVVLVTVAAISIGLVGVAVAVSISQCLTAAYALRRVAPLVNLGWRDLRRAAAGPAVATGAMLLAMLGFGAAAAPLEHPPVLAWTLVLAEVVVGAIAYAAILVAVDRHRRDSVRQTLRSMRSRPAGPVSAD